MDANKLIDTINGKLVHKKYQDLHWTGTFNDYLGLVIENPAIARTAFQRIFDMIYGYGFTKYIEYKKEIFHWHFFDDPLDNGKDAIFGMDIALNKVVNVLKAGAQRYGPEKRVLLLHGPVGSAKSTIARLLKKGIEHYSRTPEGALYTYEWINIGDINVEDTMVCPMHEDPLKLIPKESRAAVLEQLNHGKDRSDAIHIEGDINPACRFIYKKLMEKYNGDWESVVKNHIKVKRLILSEQDRIGIGTFQPKDEKNQDSTELTGDINYRKIAEYGSDSDPRAFNFDGEFNVANRGIIEFVEVLKLDVAFLYDLLTASQEHKIKPKSLHKQISMK